MKQFVVAVLCVLLPVTGFAASTENSFKVAYDGGSLQNLKAEKDETTFEEFLVHHIHGVPDFAGYLERCGGMRRMQALRQREVLMGEG